MSLRTPLSRARGAGSAHEGPRHWIVQRGTAIALVPLTLFFLSVCVVMVGADYETARAFVAQPLIAVGLILFIFTGCWHLQIGLGEVVADYVQGKAAKIFLAMLINLFSYGLGLACVLSVVRLYVTG